jgi:hypothetical protein
VMEENLEQIRRNLGLEHVKVLMKSHCWCRWREMWAYF